MKINDGNAFRYLFRKFLKLSDARINQRVFDGSQIGLFLMMLLNWYKLKKCETFLVL